MGKYFVYVKMRISSKTRKGIGLRNDIRLAVQEGTLTNGDGALLLTMLQQATQFKTVEECKLVNDKLNSMTIDLNSTRDQVKTLGHAVPT